MHYNPGKWPETENMCKEDISNNLEKQFIDNSPIPE